MKKTSSFIIVGLTIIVCGVVAVWGAKPGYRFVKDLRAKQLSAQALKLYAEAGSNETAFQDSLNKAKSAFNLSPALYESNRALGIILMYVDPGVSLQYWQQARGLEDPTRSITLVDEMNYAQVLILNHELDEAIRVVAPLRGSVEAQAQVHYNLAKLYYLKGEEELAIRYAREMVNSRFTPIYRHLFYLNILMNSEDMSDRIEGEDHVRFLLKNEDLLDDSILWEMTQLTGLTQATSSLLETKLGYRTTEHPEKLELADYQVKNGIKTAEQLFFDLHSDFAKENLPIRSLLAKWCSSYDLHENLLMVLSAEESLKRKDWFLLYIEALSKLDRWEEIEALLEAPFIPIQNFWIHILKAEAQFRQNQTGRAIRHWYRAKSETFPSIDHYWSLIHLGDKYELEKETKALLDEMVLMGVPVGQVLAYIADREFGREDYSNFYDYLEFFKAKYEKQPDVLNDWAYYSYLMDLNVSKSDEVVLALIEKYPDRLRYHMTWALGKIKEQKPRQVLARLQQFDVDWMSLHPKWRFILSLALAGVGETEQAKAYLEGEDLSGLNPFERKLFEDSFAKH